MIVRKNKLEECWNVGVDTVDHHKFKLYSMKEYPHFYQRVFTMEELEYAFSAPSPYIRIAGIFAAKEATFKALSAYGEIYLSQIGIKHMDNGKPVIWDRLNPNLEFSEIIVGSRRLVAKISISHSATNSTAFALAAPLGKRPFMQE